MHDWDCATRVLGLPEGHRVAIVLAFGYPASGRRPPVWAEESLHRGVPRIPLAELVHFERW